MRRLGLFLMLLVGLALMAAPMLAQAPPSDSLCLASVRLSNGAVQRLACVKIPRDTTVTHDTIVVSSKPDTVLVPAKPDTVLQRDTLWLPGRVDTLRLRDTLWLPKPPDTLPPPADTTTPPDTVTPPDTTPPPPPPAPGVAELPRALPVVPVGLDSLPCNAAATLGLQAALNAARGGTVLCLTGKYRGNFTVPARPDSGWIVVRDTQGCAPSRIRPSTAPSAWIQSPNNFAALTFRAGSHQVLVTCVRASGDSTVTAGPNPIIAIGQAVETTVASLPTDIALDRIYLHGYATQNVRRGVAGNGHRMSLTRSWCEEIHERGSDSQCWISWNGAGPILIEDNYLEAASENIMFGGGDPRVPGLVAQDVTIRRNHVRKPIAWKGANHLIKNLIETKASQRVLVEANVIEGQWLDNVVGHAAVVLKSTNQDGRCTACNTSDWTIRRNYFTRIANWLSIAGRADQDNGFLTDSTVRRVYIGENYVDTLSVPPWVYANRPNILFTSDNTDVTIERNTVDGAPGLPSSIMFNLSTFAPVTNLTMRDNVLPRGTYGVFATSQPDAARSWTLGARGLSTWSNNALVGARPNVNYPPGTTWHASLTSALGVAGVARAVIDAGVRGVIVPR